MPTSRQISNLAQRASRDPEALSALLLALAPLNTDEKARNRAFQALMLVAQRHPEALLPRWGELATLLKGGRAFSRYPAVHILAALAPSEEEGRFEKAFEAFYSLLDDEAISVAAHVAWLSGKIAKAKPNLQRRITRRLLSIDETHFDAGRKDLIKSYAIQAFDEYFEDAKEKKAILLFVRDQLGAKSPRSRKAAKEFLKKWETGAD
jgi:hypothetical protein